MARQKKTYAYEPDYAVPPGATLRDTLDALDMTQADLARRTELTTVSISRILTGKQPISYETAEKLELATGVPARLWNGLEAQYRQDRLRLKKAARLQEDLDWLKTIPVKELQARDFISEGLSDARLVRATLKFFGVSSVKAYSKVWAKPRVAARRSSCFDDVPGAAAAWIRQGELQAHEMDCAPYNEKEFRKSLKALRSATKKDARDFAREMQQRCAAAGVAVALVPKMAKVPWYGATRWLSPDKAMILLNLRGKGEDSFWFSFFHEAAHVLYHDKRATLIHSNRSVDDPREREADEFASEWLIPSEYRARLKALRSRKDVCKLAAELDIAPGIVAGQYRYSTKRFSFFKDLTRQLRWVDEEESE